MERGSQEGILNFPFDHIYACHTDNPEPQTSSVLQNIENKHVQNEIVQLNTKLSNIQKENCRLKDLILIHLDLIQQQSDELIQKEKDLANLQREIEKLKASNSQTENTLNFRLQNINPPPLIHLTPSQMSSTVQIANLTNLLNPGASVENLMCKKPFERKRDMSDGFARYQAFTNKDESPFTNVGTLIDTRYIQCSDNAFDNQQSICIQPIIQPMMQSSIQPIVQPIIQTTIRPTIQNVQTTLIKPESIGNLGQFKTIPLQLNKASTSKINYCSLDTNKFNKSTIQHNNMMTKMCDQSFALNKKSKTVYTYEKASKKNVKKPVKPPLTTHCHEMLTKHFKGKELIHKPFTNLLNADKMPKVIHTTPPVVCSAPSTSKTKACYSRFSSFTTSNKNNTSTPPKQLTLNNRCLLNDVSLAGKSTEVKVIKQEKAPAPRKFFTCGLKDKASCRDFSYGENYDNKSGMLEYLEGNQSSNHEGDLMDTNYISKLLSSASSSSTLLPLPDNPLLEENNLLEIKSELKEEDDMDKGTLLDNETMDMEKIDLYEFQSEDFDSSNQLNYKTMKKRCYRTNSLSFASQSFDQLMHGMKTTVSPMISGTATATATKPTPSKKKTARRKRALSSASKVSNVSQNDPPVPYSWSFSGQDFKILMEDIKSTYFINNFGSNNSFFNMNPASESCDPWSNEQTNLEVPSWREKCYSPDPYAITEEAMEEEVMLKRHFRQETKEKRRKRWDFQRIREQRHIEKLKQRQERRNSSGFKQQGKSSKVVTGGFPEELPTSFYPCPDDIFSIEIADTLPVTAFGECIPDLPPRTFHLPWLRSHHHGRSRTHSSGRKKIRIERSEEE